VSAGVLVIALLLASIQARAGVLQARLKLVPAASHSGTLAGWMILAAWLSNVIWASRTWVWYWALACALACAPLSGLLVTRRSLGFWRSMRPLVAVATAASTALLWVAYPPAY
jgi:hypothetical protein